MNRSVPALGMGIIAACLIGACSPTYVDESLLTTTTQFVSETPPDQPVETAEEFDIVLRRIADTMYELSDAIADDTPRAVALMSQINADWALVNSVVRSDYPDDLFGFEQVVSMARTAVDRRRPADASKAWKLMIDLNADVLSS